MDYTISRYEEKSDALFICITSAHCQVEHFFSEEERLTENRLATIEHLVAELEIMEDAWVAPEPVVDRTAEAKTLVPDWGKIQTAKTTILEAKAEAVRVEAEKMQAEADEKARVEMEKERAEEARIAALSNEDPLTGEGPGPG